MGLPICSVSEAYLLKRDHDLSEQLRRLGLAMQTGERGFGHNLSAEVQRYWAICKDRPLLALSTALGFVGTVGAFLDTISNLFSSGGGGQSWAGAGRPLFGDAFQGLPARILLFFVIVSALAWTCALIAVLLTTKSGQGWKIVNTLWFAFAGISVVAVVDLIFRGVLAGNSYAIFVFSVAAILQAVFLTKAQFLLVMETRAPIIEARASGMMMLTLAACLVAFVSYMPLA